MKPIHNPDEVLWRLLEIKRQLYTLRAQNHIEREAYTWKAACWNCEHKHRAPTLDGGYQCERCGEPWSLEKVAVPKSPHRNTSVGGSRYEDPRINLISQADVLVRVLELDPWDRRVYVELFCYERRTFKGTANEARQRWVKHAHLHSDKKVRRRIERCRRLVTERLEARGLVG